MRKLEIIDDKILRITQDECILEIPIKILRTCEDCSLRKANRCFNGGDEQLCYQLHTTLGGRGISFDAVEENSKAISKLLVDIYNDVGISKKKVIFRRRCEDSK